MKTYRDPWENECVFVETADGNFVLKSLLGGEFNNCNAFVEAHVMPKKDGMYTQNNFDLIIASCDVPAILDNRRTLVKSIQNDLLEKAIELVQENPEKYTGCRNMFEIVRRF